MGIFSNLFGEKEENLLESRKERLDDFFKIDIRDVFKYEPEYECTDTNIVGKEVKHYKLRLKEPELGLFYDLEILEVGKEEYNIIFRGGNNMLTKDLSEFLSFYTNKYGLDEMGCGGIEQSDYHYIDSHLFSRMWKNLMIDNNSFNSSNGNMEMCIMGIKNIHS